MPRSENQKLKLLYLMKLFSEQTDDHHGLTVQEIAGKLAGYGIAADRKTLYQDFEELTRFGFDVVSEKQGRSTVYHAGARHFELAELKLLVDSVQAAKFIPESMSRDLIRKLESLTSVHEARLLQRQVVITGRTKSANRKVLYNVDLLHTAISENRQVTFHYFQWNVKKEQVLRHGGALYCVSPWCLTWDDEYYYLVAFDSEKQKVKHYRVDKMLDLAVTGKAREGQAAFQDFNPAKYARSLFGMYSGEEVTVDLEGKNEMAAVLIDRFGTDLTLIPKGKDRFTAHVTVMLSSQFLGWIMALGDGLKITGPDLALKRMKEEVRRLSRQYLKK